MLDGSLSLSLSLMRTDMSARYIPKSRVTPKVGVSNDYNYLVVGHVLDIDPLDLELALPLVLGPDPGLGVVVHTVQHLPEGGHFS